jgi:Xaa-Pro aminopeptidase
MSDRVARLREALEEPLLVTNPVNVVYLSGFRSSNAALLVQPDRVELFTDFRYAEAARNVEGAEFIETPRALIQALAGLLDGRIGFEAGHLTYAGYETLRSGSLELVPREGLVERLRAVKGEGELESLRRAAAITDRTYERLAQERFTGRTERELAWRMEQLFREDGADELAFPIIVAAGPNGSRPHAEAGERKIEPGQTIVVDAGCSVGGYNSDCTRTFATGALPERLGAAYAVCLEAQEAGLAAVRAGRTGKEVDADARDRIDATEFKGTFGHGLGHGVGLLVHEAPSLRPESEETLVPGNVVTVEPGIYLEGIGGIRIEDLVVVTADGCEVLSGFTKELTTVD